MFEQTFKNIDDLLYKDSGADSELDYIGQTSWVLFLRYLHDLEKEKAEIAELSGQEHHFILDDKFQWSSWAMPKVYNSETKKYELDDDIALTGTDLVRFVDSELFPYLADFKQKADNPQTIEYKIGEIFSELKNKIQSGYNLREILGLIDELPLKSTKDKHELSHLYETKIKNMGNAGRNGGQYYTPRPLIRAMIQVVNPKIGEKIYDGAVGSAGFLCEAFEYIKKRMEQNTSNLETLQKHTFYGKEKKNLAYIIGVMNMILHGIEAPNIRHVNTLSLDIRNIQEKDRYDVILANPPFGGKERKEVQENFYIKTGETAFLFLQHFMKSLKTGGRCAIVIKNTFLSNTDNASISLRKELLETCNLHTVLDMPAGTFTGAGVKTVVLFFEKGEPTKKTWFYQLDAGRNMGKTNPLNDKDMTDFLELQAKQKDSAKSWVLRMADMDKETFDLSVKNPNAPKEKPLRKPHAIFDQMEQLDKDTSLIFKDVKDNYGLFYNKLHEYFTQNGKWEMKKWSEVLEIRNGKSQKAVVNPDGKYPIYGSGGRMGYADDYICNEETTIIGRKGSINNPIYVNEKFWNVDTAFGLSALDNLHNKFLYYFCLSYDFSKRDKGTTLPSLTKKDLFTMEMPLPPMSKQEEIVTELDNISKNINNLISTYEQKLSNLEELRKSILEQAFTGNLTV